MDAHVRWAVMSRNAFGIRICLVRVGHIARYGGAIGTGQVTGEGGGRAHRTRLAICLYIRAIVKTIAKNETDKTNGHIPCA